ncbi:outer membrane beta-barrel protein [Pontibacter sp. G13]|uniref:outer membrane beta-barrel protein n=1 Tax=Pontibacter sp. G13 TaxID=3074898 RepID=UPI00288AE56C|nr:outer membrane beta-barrel protein [Pontibacter sp. G13]WNJ20942.1 outer membrane beta-barrel protein [Pontibacter sp. G13]
MYLSRFMIVAMLMAMITPAWAQEEESSSLSISGSVDTYYKYDFSGQANIGTSFAGDHNSISIGMLDLVFEKSSGKASFVGEIAMGPRNAESAGPAFLSGLIPVEGSEPVGIAAFQPRIQNLYVSYAFTDKLTITGGYMGTFVGYEIISPTGNFNYSTSYLFTNGPFQNAGVKLEYAFSDKFGVMVGVFNPWNVYTADPEVGPTSIGAQIYVAPVEGWDAYVNFTTGDDGMELDLTTTFQVTDELMLGLNAASYSDMADTAATFAGAAAYVNYAITESAALGLRYEYFAANSVIGILSEEKDATVSAITLSGNFGGGDLTFIPEFRVDLSSVDMFMDADGMATGTASQFLLAAVYAF